MLNGLYSNLSATIITSDWTTPGIRINVGVFQGDPLSVVVFNTVINTLVDTLKTRTDLGYSLSDLHDHINLLQYVDNTCFLAHSEVVCQHLLNMVDKWLSWSCMTAKIAKCSSMGIHGSTGNTFNPNLTLSGELLPFLERVPSNFLAWPS